MLRITITHDSYACNLLVLIRDSLTQLRYLLHKLAQLRLEAHALDTFSSRFY